MGYSFQKRLIEEGFSSLLQHKKVVLAAAPGSGKTNMAIDMIKLFQDKKKDPTILILAHNQCFLRNQWSEFLWEKKVDHSILIGRNYSEDMLNNSKGVFLALPQSLLQISMPKIDLLITDESHHYYLSPMSLAIRELAKPKHEILLTGTPSLFLDKEDYSITGITIQELIKHNVIHDPQIEIINSAYTYNYKDYKRSTYDLTKGTLKKLETDATLDKLLKEITLRLASRKRTSLQWCKTTANWPVVSRKLHKTMIVCSDIEHASDVKDYFDKKGVECVLSVCKDRDGYLDYLDPDGTKAIDRFKEDKNCNILIVVRRGILGFNFEELTNIVDLSGSWNVNRLFQLLCRVIRKNPNNNKRKKLFFKVTNPAMFPLTYFVMSFVVAMSHEKYYYSFKDKNARRHLQIPIHKRFNKLIEEMKTGIITKQHWPEVPTLLTFKDIDSIQKNVETASYTSFDEVIRLIEDRQENWSNEKVIKILGDCKTKKEFREKHKAAYNFILRTKKTWLLDQFFGPLKRWNLKSVLETTKKYKSRGEFRRAQAGAYNWIKKNHNLDKLDPMFKPRLVSKSAVSVSNVLKDPKFKIYIDGTILRLVKGYRGKPDRWVGAGCHKTASRDKRTVINYHRKKVPVNRIIYTKFVGPIKETEALKHIDGDKKNCSLNNLEVTTVLKACRAANTTWNPKRNMGRKYKINHEIAAKMRADHVSGMPYSKLCKKYSLSKSNVSMVINQKTWKV